MRTRNTDKQQLVRQKAIEMVVTDGLDGFSVNKLARACNISVATLYIYYKDKDDLIRSISKEEVARMNDIVLKDFDPEMKFAEGLRVQWKNRFTWMMEYPNAMRLFDQLRGSSYGEEIFQDQLAVFKQAMERFTKNAVKRGEIRKMTLEAFWATAFAPLHVLVRFHYEGKSLGGKPFTISSKVLWETFDMVVKGLTI